VSDHGAAGATDAARARAIRESNARHYEARETVDGYLLRPYHELRLALCEELLRSELAAAFPDRPAATLRILELGASGGTLARSLARAGHEVVATDLQPAPLASMGDTAIRCLCHDSERPFPFASQSFHGVVLAELIEHLFDTRTLLEEIARVLVDGGVLVVTTPNLATLQDRLRFLLGKAPRQIDPLHEYLYLHIRPFTFASLVQSLAWAGLDRFQVRSNYVVFRFAGGRRLHSRVLARLFPRLGGSLIVAGRKPAGRGPS
jgi:2-polyprenyl-3-methyl-5-hydroxy-6-metoxy-1,4-benzoquinol methylase